MSELVVGSIAGLASNDYVVSVASGSKLVQPGSVLQVVNTIKDVTFSTTSTSYVDVTGLSASITPTATTSKILVLVDVALGNSGSQGTRTLGQILRDSTPIGNNATSSNSLIIITAFEGNRSIETKSLGILDSPSTTSAVTYKIQVKTDSGTGYVNRGGSTAALEAVSSITLMEIAG